MSLKTDTAYFMDMWSNPPFLHHCVPSTNKYKICSLLISGKVMTQTKLASTRLLLGIPNKKDGVKIALKNEKKKKKGG